MLEVGFMNELVGGDEERDEVVEEYVATEELEEGPNRDGCASLQISAIGP